jgi:putative transposase
VGLAEMKASVGHLRSAFRLSERRACHLVGLAVSSYRYRSIRSDDGLREKLRELARQRTRFGYRRLHALLAGEETAVNHKRVWRVYREAGLSLSRKRRRRLVRAGRPMQVVTAANEEWALDFVSDAIQGGRRIRVLTVVDAFTRECLALEVDTSFASPRVTRTLDAAINRRGRPRRIRCDNGPELTSRHFLAWCLERGIEPAHIQPGRPMQNGRVESFNGRLRDEFLNVSWFGNLFDARRQAAEWQKDYNEVRPHSSLGYRTPRAFAEGWNSVTSPSTTAISDEGERRQGNPSGSLREALTPPPCIAFRSTEEGEVTY